MKFFELKTGQLFRFETDTIDDPILVSCGGDWLQGMYRHVLPLGELAPIYYCSPNDAVIPLEDKP